MITLLNQPWTERLGWTLLHFLWQGILVAAIYALARALAGGRMSARGRYAMACAALLAMTAVPAVTYWWLGASGPTAPIGDLAGPGARQVGSGVAYSPVTDRWQQAMPAIVMTWFVGAAGVLSDCSWDSSLSRPCGVRLRRECSPNGSKSLTG